MSGRLQNAKVIEESEPALDPEVVTDVLLTVNDYMKNGWDVWSLDRVVAARLNLDLQAAGAWLTNEVEAWTARHLQQENEEFTRRQEQAGVVGDAQLLRSIAVEAVRHLRASIDIGAPVMDEMRRQGLIP